MADPDKPETQALILKQLKSIKVALWAHVVMIVLLTGVITLGGCFIVYYADLAERKFFGGSDEDEGYPADNPTDENSSG